MDKHCNADKNKKGTKTLWPEVTIASDRESTNTFITGCLMPLGIPDLGARLQSPATWREKRQTIHLVKQKEWKKTGKIRSHKKMNTSLMEMRWFMYQNLVSWSSRKVYRGMMRRGKKQQNPNNPSLETSVYLFLLFKHTCFNWKKNISATPQFQSLFYYCEPHLRSHIIAFYGTLWSSLSSQN